MNVEIFQKKVPFTGIDPLEVHVNQRRYNKKNHSLKIALFSESIFLTWETSSEVRMYEYY